MLFSVSSLLSILFDLKLSHGMEYYPHIAKLYNVRTNLFSLIWRGAPFTNFCQHKNHIWFLCDFCFCFYASNTYRMSIFNCISCLNHVNCECMHFFSRTAFAETTQYSILLISNTYASFICFESECFSFI